MNITNIKWQYTLIVGLFFAVIYIIVDDNNIVARNIEGVFYYIAWLGIFSTIFLVLRKRFRKNREVI